MATKTTPKQAALITKLQGQLNIDQPMPATARQAGDMIDHLLGLAKANQANKFAAANAAAAAELDMFGVAPVQAGRHTLTGRFHNVTQKDTPFGLVWKGVFVTDEGNRIHTTVPAAIMNDLAMVTENGRVVALPTNRMELTVTITTVPGDNHFGFGKKPAGMVFPFKGRVAA